MRYLLMFALSMLLYACAKNKDNEFDYSSMIILDAESLAEEGIKEAFEEKKIEFLKVNLIPAEVREVTDNDLPSYTVITNDMEYKIYTPYLMEEEWQSWGRATHAFFDIVNRQLRDTDIKLYAFYAGNDLSGMFLSSEQYERALKIISNNSDKPYLPTLESPLYGQPQ